MSDTPPKRDAKSLVNSILATTPNTANSNTTKITSESIASTNNNAEPTELITTDPEELAKNLINVYFDTEKPEERDLIINQLLTINRPIVKEFLRSMMSEDEDEFMRSTAAVALAQDGDAEAITKLEKDLTAPEESVFFANAIDGLMASKGAALYDTLKKIWRDSTYDTQIQRQAMFGMEKVDAPRALTDFVAFINEQQNLENLADDQLEVAILIFYRHEHTSGLKALQTLSQRIEQVDYIEDYIREDLLGLLQEGIELLSED